MNEDTDLESLTLGTECQACQTPLEAPWIRCASCHDPSVDLCARCFCNGAEVGSHESDHPYTVVVSKGHRISFLSIYDSYISSDLCLEYFTP